MPFIPRFKLYDDTGNNLLYTFPLVQYTNSPQDPKKSVEIKGFRGRGGIIIPGSDDMWDLIIKGILIAEDYELLTEKIEEIKDTIVLFTPYYLKINKYENPESGQTANFEYKVKRISAIDFEESKRVRMQSYTITFKVNSW
jgi:hypothetical protein